MFSIVIDPSAFDNSANMERRTNEFYDFIKSRQPANGVDEVLMPGEPEQRNRQSRAREGIAVDDQTLEQIMQVTSRFPGVTELQCQAIRDLLIPIK